MDKLYIWGYCTNGIRACEYIKNSSEYSFEGFIDNSPYKIGNYAYGKKIHGYETLLETNDEKFVLVAISKWQEVYAQCENNEIIKIIGVFEDNDIVAHKEMFFENLDFSKGVKFYAGDICDDIHINEKNLYGLSLVRSDNRHIRHNIIDKFPIDDDSIIGFEAEDVFEYVPEDKIVDSINEIYRILKPGCVCRITLPDYNSEYAKNRTMKDKDGRFLFDVCGGGNYTEHGIEGGSINFYTQREFHKLLELTDFNKIEWLCYRDDDGKLYRNPINNKNGYSRRIVNESDETVYSMLVDLYK